MIRKALKKDYSEILKLNRNDVEMLSPLDYNLLGKMDELSEIFQVIEEDNRVIAFILAFKDGCDYWSDNYGWFLDNYTNFIYIDRIVIDESYRKRGLAQELYEHLFDYALKNKYNLVCAEIDIEPEYNCPSIRFHEKMGFRQVGTRISKQTLTVSLQVKELK
ncbi:GNAT family N-acetyltransferase [uncultured Methanobrevibacter sp.]|uniref:GNAT family N-acetyltransferase n=1 Tax=uncultured Methanobrevibacter sp. TaxID=253161 RepID=UPI0025D7591B|nr:GNAT family N-acetyltransferase [uncultured Methanobrevibacter sp.]